MVEVALITGIAACLCCASVFKKGNRKSEKEEEPEVFRAPQRDIPIHRQGESTTPNYNRGGESTTPNLERGNPQDTRPMYSQSTEKTSNYTNGNASSATTWAPSKGMYPGTVAGGMNVPSNYIIGANGYTSDGTTATSGSYLDTGRDAATRGYNVVNK